MPVKAIDKAQSAAAQAALDFIMAVGFETDDNGVKKIKCTEIEFEETNSDGTVSINKKEIPTLNIIPLPIVNVK